MANAELSGACVARVRWRPARPQRTLTICWTKPLRGRINPSSAG